MKEWTACEICGRTAENKHHVFNGANRKHSEKYNLTMMLCCECHRLLHSNYEIWNNYKRVYQLRFEAQYGHEAFMKIFGRNYT